MTDEYHGVGGRYEIKNGKRVPVTEVSPKPERPETEKPEESNTKLEIE